MLLNVQKLRHRSATTAINERYRWGERSVAVTRWDVYLARVSVQTSEGITPCVYPDAVYLSHGTGGEGRK